MYIMFLFLKITHWPSQFIDKFVALKFFMPVLLVLVQPIVCHCWICMDIHTWPLSTTWTEAAWLQPLCAAAGTDIIIRTWHNPLITSDWPYFLFCLYLLCFICTDSVAQVLTFPLSSDQSVAAAFHAMCFDVFARGIITVHMLTDLCCFDDALHRNVPLTVISSLISVAGCDATCRVHCCRCPKSVDGKIKLHPIYMITQMWM